MEEEGKEDIIWKGEERGRGSVSHQAAMGLTIFEGVWQGCRFSSNVCGIGGIGKVLGGGGVSVWGFFEGR